MAVDICLVLAIVTHSQTHCGPSTLRHDLSAAQHFPTRAPLFLFYLPPCLAIFLFSKSDSLSLLSLYHKDGILTKAMSTMHDSLFLNIAGLLT